MSKAPPIPREQRSFHAPPDADLPSEDPGRRDRRTGLQSTETGDRDVNLAQQGRQGNTQQNVRDVQDKVQDR